MEQANSVLYIYQIKIIKYIIHTRAFSGFSLEQILLFNYIGVANFEKCDCKHAYNYAMGQETFFSKMLFLKSSFCFFIFGRFPIILGQLCSAMRIA